MYCLDNHAQKMVMTVCLIFWLDVAPDLQEYSKFIAAAEAFPLSPKGAL